jgi:trypsin
MRIELSLACALVALVVPASASAVVGGTAVPSGGYAFVVAVGDSKGPDCGGTLIAPSVVLTAAHCVAGITDPAALHVLAGSHSISGDLARQEAAGHAIGVSAIYVHPKFTVETMRYDAALLILEHPVAGVRPLALAASSPPAGAAVSAAGWGETEQDGAPSPDHLRSVALEVGTTQSCKRGNAVLGTYFAPSMLCAGSPGRDTCSGDSGGPLVATSHGRLALVGITSFGLGCARIGHPGVYTRVSAIRGWARAQLARARAAAARLAALENAPAPAA